MNKLNGTMGKKVVRWLRIIFGNIHNRVSKFAIALHSRLHEIWPYLRCPLKFRRIVHSVRYKQKGHSRSFYFCYGSLWLRKSIKIAYVVRVQACSRKLLIRGRRSASYYTYFVQTGSWTRSVQLRCYGWKTV